MSNEVTKIALSHRNVLVLHTVVVFQCVSLCFLSEYSWHREVTPNCCGDDGFNSWLSSFLP